MDSIVNSFRREARRLAASPLGPGHGHLGAAAGRARAVVDLLGGLPRHLAVGVVDERYSSLSRELVRMLDATPGVQITQHYANATEGRARCAPVESLCRGSGPA